VTGPIPEEIAKAIMVEVLRAIQFAHENGVMHMDLKPGNIMVADNGDIKVLDFGISTEEGEKDYKVMGSPLYMSPEQIKGIGIDFASDIYSLGVTLYQMITGKEPYPSNITREELFQRILHSPFLNRSGVDKGTLSQEFSRVIQKATQKDKKSAIKVVTTLFKTWK
jgi:serine/threonine protein kinase